MGLHSDMLEYLLKNRQRPLLQVLSEWSPPKTEDPSILKRKPKKIPKQFVKCPITGCHKPLNPDFVMAHYLKSHEELRVQRVFDDCFDAVDINFDFSCMEQDKVYCLKFLSFGGEKNKKFRANLPVIGCRSTRNRGLPLEFQALAYDLPILILACENILLMPFRLDEQGLPRGKNCVAVWAVTIDNAGIARKLYCRIKIKNPEFLVHKNTWIEMRSFNDSTMALVELDPSTFYLEKKDINKLLKNYEELNLSFLFSLYPWKVIEGNEKFKQLAGPDKCEEIKQIVDEKPVKIKKNCKQKKSVNKNEKAAANRSKKLNKNIKKSELKDEMEQVSDTDSNKTFIIE